MPDPRSPALGLCHPDLLGGRGAWGLRKEKSWTLELVWWMDPTQLREGRISPSPASSPPLLLRLFPCLC